MQEPKRSPKKKNPIPTQIEKGATRISSKRREQNSSESLKKEKSLKGAPISSPTAKKRKGQDHPATEKEKGEQRHE